VLGQATLILVAIFAGFAALLAVLSSNGAAQNQNDPTIMAILLGQCTYRDAMAQSALSDVRRQTQELATYWKAWVEGEARPAAQPPRSELAPK
jgi:hypothetical protein